MSLGYQKAIDQIADQAAEYHQQESIVSFLLHETKHQQAAE
ncbi:MAG: hypothetical protein JWQ78_846, partial [Sediminibacterium sp.]|nr:hypothetical protein [Sediminibacterium sp.]